MINLVSAGFFCLGLALGSFVNVLALRYQPERGLIRKETAGGRSRCMRCERTLRWYELLPFFSFVFLRRRCLTCKGPISWQYPIVELACGFGVAYLPFFFAQFFNIGNLFYYRSEFLGFYVFVFLWLLIFLALILMSAIDARLYVIPDEVSIFIGILGLLAAAVKFTGGVWLQPLSQNFIKNYALIFSFFDSVILNYVLGFVIGGLFFLMLYISTRGRAFGFGDVKLAFALGLALGYPDVILAFFFAFLLGGAWGLALILFGRKKMKSIIPFGPFMALGAFAVMFFGHEILKWYFSLFLI